MLRLMEGQSTFKVYWCQVLRRQAPDVTGKVERSEPRMLSFLRQAASSQNQRGLKSLIMKFRADYV